MAGGGEGGTSDFLKRAVSWWYVKKECVKDLKRPG